MNIRISFNKNPTRVYEVSRELELGAGADSDILLSDPTTSQRHAKVYPENNFLWIVDHGSKNGTYIDDRRLISETPYRIEEDDVVRLGTSTILEHTSENYISQSETLGKPREASELTLLIGEKELKKIKTKKVAKKNRARGKNTVVPPLAYVFSILVIGFVAFYFLRYNEAPVVDAAIANKSELVNTREKKFREVSVLEGIRELLKAKECRPGLEEKICKHFGDDIYSARVIGNDVFIMIRSNKFITKSLTTLREYQSTVGLIKTGASEDPDPKDVTKIAFMEFLNHSGNNPLPVEPDQTIYFANGRDFTDVILLTTVIKVRGSKMKEIQDTVTPDLLKRVAFEGSSALNSIDPYIDLQQAEQVRYMKKDLPPGY